MQKVPLTVRGAQLLKDELQHPEISGAPAVIEGDC